VERLRALSSWPLVVAPMAGGPSTVDLVAAATSAGALAFLAGGYKTAAQMADEIDAVRAAGVTAFGLNVFVPGRPAADPPAAYPEINNATRPLRAAAARVGDVEHMSLYAGTAFRAAEARPAAEVVERLVSGLRR